MPIDLSVASLANVPERIVEIGRIFGKDPRLYIPLVGRWFIFEMYYIVHKGDSVREVDVLDNGLSACTLVFTSHLLFRG
ncbi:MAG: hypothetical protein QXK37_04515 [Candidatus Woesearchaeota archaeon]